MTSQIPTTRQPDLDASRSRFEQAAATPTAQITEGLTVLAGLWIALAPWIVGFAAGSPALAINNLVVGLAIAGLAVGYASAFGRMHGIAWVGPLLGVWTIIAQWVMHAVPATAPVVISNVVGGGLVVLLALGGAAALLNRR